MATKKVLVVFGATGAQGGSVVKSILSDSKTREVWTVRGVTRDTSKPSAKALEALGAETVAADLSDKSTFPKALEGAYAVFAVTNYWDTMNAEKEIEQGKAIADAAKEAGVQHFIFSSLLDITKLSGGVLNKVFHFDSKAHVEEYIRTLDLPTTFYLPGFYMANIPGQIIRQLPPNNTWALTMPSPASAPVPLLAAAEDTGKFVKGILLNREKTLGKRILGATSYQTLQEVLDDFKAVFPEAGKDAPYIDVPHDAYKAALASAGMPEFVQEELLQNMRLLGEFGYYGGASLDESHSILVDKLTTWKEFAKTAPAFAGLK
ncbi:NmrA-like family protein [Phlyctema vagabunda]|uniref:NmrA-like family protein n=1 Tax=Phlyctema vagabunda TaxID=108571 RepID=A0ABR4PFQ8_9HELO